MKKVLVAIMILALTLTACFCFVGCDTEKPVVGLICLHGDTSTYDKNFIDAFKAACEAKGLSENQYVIVSNIPEGQECYNEAAKLADAGCKAVFADSFGHESYLAQAAAEFTDVEFYHATGVSAHVKQLSNFHNAFASIYEGRYLAGYAAGLKLNEMIDGKQLKADNYENGKIKLGYVGAFTFAEVISGYTSWFLGVQAACKEDVCMKVTFTGSWYDEQGEKQAAETLINTYNCALISQHADSWGAPTACETAGVPNVSYNGSTEVNCPNTYIVSSKINWQPYFEMIIDKALGKDVTIGYDYTGTIASASVQLAAFGSKAPAANTATEVEAIKAELLAGTRKVFDCSTFTVKGQALTTYMADTDGDYKGDAEAIVTEGGVTYFNESAMRSAPYFDVQIDLIELLNTNFGD